MIELKDYTTSPAVSFHLPEDSVRKNLKVGDTVKAVFVAPPNLQERGVTAERMWIKVTEVLEDGKYKGHLDSKPVVVTNLSPGMVVDFAWNHVISIWEDEE